VLLTCSCTTGRGTCFVSEHNSIRYLHAAWVGVLGGGSSCGWLRVSHLEHGVPLARGGGCGGADSVQLAG
jgi:hypothetical protein